MFEIIGILGLALLMVVHEGGHLLAARSAGLRVTKFSIGFGPTFFKIVPNDGYFWLTLFGERVKLRLFKHDEERHGPTVYQVAMIPFLAYVQIAGMNPFEEVDPKDKGSYANAGILARIITIFSGPAANYLFASVLFFLAIFFGARATEVSVIQGRPAAGADIRDGDRIAQVAGVEVDDWKAMADVISVNPGKTIPIVVERRGERIEFMVTPSDESGRGLIGVQPRGPEKKDAKEAAILALKKPATVVRDLVVGLGQYVTGKAEGELVGPVGIVKETGRAAKSSASQLLYLLGALSAYLGAFNLIPFPALDGGRLMFLAYEATTRRRPNAKVEAQIHAVGLVMMLGLIAWVTFNDLGFGSK